MYCHYVVLEDVKGCVGRGVRENVNDGPGRGG